MLDSVALPNGCYPGPRQSAMQAKVPAAQASATFVAMTDRTGLRGDQRWWLVLGPVPTMLLIAPLLLAWPWAGRWPDPIAVHWGLDGAPNGTMSLAANQTLSTALALVFWAIGAVMVRNARAWRVRRSVATVTAGAIGFLTLLAVAVLRANLDQLSWQGASRNQVRRSLELGRGRGCETPLPRLLNQRRGHILELGR